MSKNRLFYFGIATILSTQIAFADVQLNPGEVQLDVNGIILDIEEPSTVDEINFNGDSFTVTMSPSQFFKISSSEKRDFTVSPTASAVKACESSKSILTIQPSSGNVYTITPGSANSCIVGGGGGIVGAGAAPPPSPPPAEQPPAQQPPAQQPPAEQPPTQQPPAEQPPAQQQQPPAPPPITVTETVQGIQTISSGAAQTVSAVSSGIVEIFRGITTGQSGAGTVAENIPNSGLYVWDTSKSPFPLSPGGYTVTIIFSSDANIQDTSDATFNFISQAAADQLEAESAGISEAPGNQEHSSASLLQILSPSFDFLKELFSVKMADAQSASTPSITVLQPNGGETWVIGQTQQIIWQSQNLPATSFVTINVTKKFNITETLTNVGKQVQKTVQTLKADPVVTKTVTQVTAPVATTVSVATAGALAVTASTGSAAFAINLSEIFQTLSLAKFYLFGLIRFRRRKPWGRVSDKLSGMPMRGATIQIYESEFKKLKDSQITDEEGRFGTLIDPGIYYIKVSKKGYQDFQSDPITITSSDQTLNLELYLSPLHEEWTLEYVRKINVVNFVKRFIELINPYLLALGTLLSAVSLIIVPSTLNTVTFVIYIALDILKIYFAMRLIKPLGTIIDENTNAPLALAVIRIFDQEKNWLLATKVADNQGRFNFLLSPGKYYVTCSRAGYLPYKSESILLRKDAMPSLNIKLKPAA